MFLIEHYLLHGGEKSSPREAVENFVVFVIDDSRIDSARLGPDPSFENAEHFRRYQGVIDVSGMPVIGAVEMFAERPEAASIR